MTDMRKAALFIAGLLLCVACIIVISGEKIVWRLPENGMEVFGGGREELLFPGQEGSGLSLEKKLSVLEELDFQFSEEEKRAMEEWPEAGYEDLLALVGWGEFDLETWEWSPTSDQVYALDTEVFNIDRMYPDFFQGLLSISNGELPITNVVQDDSEVNWEKGTGTFQITLHYGEKPYSFTATAMNDWLDVGILGQVNDMLKKEGVEKRFYATWNSMQGITVFYRDKDWAQRFEAATGCKLYTKF